MVIDDDEKRGMVQPAALRTIAACLVLSAALAAGGPTAGTRQQQDRSFPVTTPGGPRTVEAAERFLDLTYGGGDVKGAVVAFYDPERRVFCWVFGLAGAGPRPGILESFRRTAILHLADDTLVLFTMRGRSLAIRASAERAGSLEQALDAAAAAVETKRAAYFNAEVLIRGYDLYTLVDLSKLGNDFFSIEGSAALAPAPQVVRVVLTDGTWEVTLQGPNTDRVVVRLSASYELRGWRADRVR